MADETQKAAQELVDFIRDEMGIETDVQECLAGVERWVVAFGANGE